MPKLVLAAVALLLHKPPSAYTADAQPAMHARIRSRQASRRLRASRAYEARFDLRALDLTGRH